MKVHVDRDACQVSGLCTGLAPDVFELDERGDLVILDETPPPHQHDDVQEAVRSCPLQALFVTDN
ncbi:ferredoxin [Streptomyces sp. NPDC058464]|uniref:ferredoxin n=1 Tax=Streptomyces sp. NPDC058464 TaxID=3346511 RepID=UPI0036621FED